MNKIFIDDLAITEKITLSPLHAILRFKCKKKNIKIFPGQFINIRVNNHHSSILRRPFSIFDHDISQNLISIFIKSIGEISRCIYDKNAGDCMDIMYPLGNSFTLCKNKNVLLVGGGYGVAPLYFLSKKLINRGNKIDLLIGANSTENLHLTDFFHSSIKIHITTEDGSIGQRGKVTDHKVLQRNNFDAIYTCGPKPMMKAIARFAKLHNIHTEVSLDQLMACGFGVCLCCVVNTTNGYLCTCTDGPVINISNLLW